MHLKTNNNDVTIIGKAESNFTYNHEIYKERFYKTVLSVERRSKAVDGIPVVVPGRLIDTNQDYKGRLLKVQGSFRSFNFHGHLCLCVFAREIECIDKVDENISTNTITLNGCLCKEPICRKTPLGRDIADLLLTVDRPYGKSDYIPCICWGQTALNASTLHIGDQIFIKGRIQSREYIKKNR